MDSDPQATKRPTPKFKKFLRIFTLVIVVVYVLLWADVRYLQYRAAHVVVRLKSEAELSKIPVSADSYPCLLIERIGGKPNQPLRSSLRQCLPALHNDDEIEQYEVDLRSGLFVLRKTDLFISDSMPLALTRGYHVWDRHSRAFGIGGNHAYDIFPIGDHYPYTYMDLVLGDGASVHYDRISEGSSYVDFVNEHRGTPPTAFEKSQVRWNADHWDLTFADGTRYNFPEAYRAKRPVDGALVGMRNPNGEEIKLVRDARHNLTSLTSPHGHQIRFTYDEAERVTQADDDGGHTIRYSYDPDGRLSEVQKDGNVVCRYLYTSRRMTAVQDSGGNDILVMEYSGGRVSRVIQHSSGIYYFDYLLTPNGYVRETTITDSSGKKIVLKF